MRAQRKRGGARGIGSDSELESGSDGGGRRSRQAGPPWQRDREGRVWRARLGQGRGNGPAGRKLRGEKEKKDMGWAEKDLGERKKFSIFQNDSNIFNLNSNSKI